MSQNYAIEGKIPKRFNDLLINALKTTLFCLDKDGVVLIDLSFCSKRKIRKLNKQFRKIDMPTDVLSFPFEQDDELIGSIAICLKIAKKQSKEFGHSYEREVTYLFVHGLLHLFGYDHQNDDDKSKMRLKEEEIMGKLNLLRDNQN